MKIIYGEDGFVLRVITAASVDFDIKDHLLPGEAAIDGVAEPGLDKVVAGNLVVAPARPSVHHVFDKPSFSWILNLDTAKEKARERINTDWKAAEQSGFTAYGKVFDADDKAIQRTSVAAQAAMLAKAAGNVMEIDWTCADNSIIHLDTDQLIAMPIIMAVAANALHVKCTALKAQITAANTLAEIDAAVW